ncbi:MAG: hypothetical protein Q8N83_00125 [Ignavibacteria bacterium]|nr:hypothetical protein [Ignavibacteria bacterium]
MKILLTFLILIFGFSTFSMAQSQFIEKGKAGALMLGSFGGSKFGNSYGLGMGFSIAGVVDIGFSVAQSNSTERKGNETAVTEVFTNIFLSKTKGYLAANIAYVADESTGYTAIGFCFGKNYVLSNTFQLQPILSYHLLLLSGFQLSMLTSSIGLSLDLLISNHFVISPGFGYTNNVLIGELSIGILISS